MSGEGLENYFRADELDAARDYVEVFHGSVLLNNEIARRDTVLLGLYMVCNWKGSSQIPRQEASDFISKLGVPADDFTKGLSSVKDNGQVSIDSRGNIALTFTGLK